MSRAKSKGKSLPVIIKSEPCNDDVHYTDKIKVESETKVDLEYIKEDMKEESLMEVKQEEFIIKDEIPSSSDTQNNLTDGNVVLTEDIELLPTSINTKTIYKTSNKQDLKRHIDCHTREKPSSNAKFQCAECEYKTSNKAHLVHHMVIHTGEMRFGCNLCDFKTAWKNCLNRHMMKHTGGHPFICNLCEFKAANKCHFNRHLRTHTGEKPFACNLCDFKSSMKGSLKNHLLTHTGEKKH